MSGLQLITLEVWVFSKCEIWIRQCWWRIDVNKLWLRREWRRAGLADKHPWPPATPGSRRTIHFGRKVWSFLVKQVCWKTNFPPYLWVNLRPFLDHFLSSWTTSLLIDNQFKATGHSKGRRGFSLSIPGSVKHSFPFSKYCRCTCTAPTWKGDLNLSKRGPKGDLILSEKGTKRGPSATEKGTKWGPKKHIFDKLTETC